jgi:hypothetical protein
MAGGKRRNTDMSLNEILTEVEKLTPEERKELMAALREAERQDADKATEAGEEKPFRTIFDVAPDIVGSVDSGLTDLATNKKYMEGYGRD